MASEVESREHVEILLTRIVESLSWFLQTTELMQNIQGLEVSRCSRAY